MPEDTRLRSPHHERDSILEWTQKPSTKAELEELRAKVNQLEYGGITADKLGGGTISSQSIELAENASLFSGSPSSDGFVLDKDGLRFYDGGVNTIDLRADGGAATFTGNITASTITGGTFRTAASGARIELDEGTYDEVDFYTGDAAEDAPGRILVTASGTALNLLQVSPRTTSEDYAYTFVYGGKGAGDPGAWGAATLNSSDVIQSAIGLDSNTGLYMLGQAVNITVQDGIFQFARPSATNATQLRFKTVPTPGTFEVALGVDSATGAQVNVQSWAASTPLPISASAFTVVSRTEGKEKIEERKTPVLNRVKALKPVNYVRREGDTEKSYVGFMAEEMMTQFPEAVVKDTSGAPHSIDLMAVLAILCQGIQELAVRGN